MTPPDGMALNRKRVKPVIFNLFWKTVDLVFPPFCIECGKLGERICRECIRKIQWIYPPFCEFCGSPAPNNPRHSCIDPTKIQQIRSAAVFTGPIRKALHAIKYRNDQSLASAVSQLSMPFWPIRDWGIHLIAPVPLGKKREGRRGYNQALLLAKALSEYTNIPIRSDLVYRVKETRSQVGLSYAERQTNLTDAFQAVPVPEGRILLVDDVCTTGATLQMSGCALQRAGAESVYGISVARAMIQHFPS
jgi:competence protein ComFC